MIGRGRREQSTPRGDPGRSFLENVLEIQDVLAAIQRV